MNRFKIAAICTIFAATLVGCDSEAPLTEVNGTVENVGFAGTGNLPKRFIKLEDNPNVYVCYVDDVNNCGVIDKGQKVNMQVNGNLSIDSLTYVEPNQT